MKNKHEKGATGIDVVGGIIIFIISSVAILNIYYNIYLNTVTIKVHQVAIGCITEVFERIDLENYDSVTMENIRKWIEEAGMYKYFNEEKNHSHVEYTLSNYAEETGAEEDILKKVNITVVYTINEKSVKYSINKIKVRE